ncbi:TrmH family RNA methyltransferase [Kamptonema cortianum]|nr:TrmH family RNA methyltransferase [Geitlerinema splendidum]MDK3156189.1 TrmH family RNA methyltransferase [Kamptonema cortianum]
MKRLRFPQRQQRIAEDYEESWINSRRTAPDPGLRDSYEKLPKSKVRLLACRLEKAVNHGGLVRLAECFRLEHVFFEKELDEAVDLSGMKGAHEWQPHEFGDLIDELGRLRAEGWTIYGLTLGQNSIGIQACDWKFPCAIVVGEERLGVRDDILALCHHTVAIPLWGITTSLNVGQAAAIAVHSAVQQYARETFFEPARETSRGLLRKLR